MIYLSDDYLTKYCDTISYLLARSYSEGYSFDFIQRTISYSRPISELEKSDITTLAFSSFERIYNNVFPEHNNEFVFNPYDSFGWSGYAYVHLFLKMKITFEALFYLIPLKDMLNLYHLYHEMNVSQIEEYASDIIKYSILDIIMKTKSVSNSELSEKTNLSLSTINALRYKKRDINKLEAYKLMLIANALDVKIETLLQPIDLKFM